MAAFVEYLGIYRGPDPGLHVLALGLAHPAEQAHQHLVRRVARVELPAQIDARLTTISKFNGRLDEIHTILETVIGFVTPDRIIEFSTEPKIRADDDSSPIGYRVFAHVSRDNGSFRPGGTNDRAALPALHAASPAMDRELAQDAGTEPTCTTIFACYPGGEGT